MMAELLTKLCDRDFDQASSPAKFEFETGENIWNFNVNPSNPYSGKAYTTQVGDNAYLTRRDSVVFSVLR